jgi:enoyl-CoA hydratase
MDRMTEAGNRADVVRVDHSVAQGVVWIELANPAQRNCLGVQMMSELERALSDATAKCSVVCITAQGEDFCSGFDIHDDTPLSPRFLRIGMLLNQIRELDALTVAIVHGRAIGAGADIVTHCDIRIVLPDASFRFPGFQKYGVVLGSARLAELIGIVDALDAIAATKVFSAREAVSLGLATAGHRNQVEAREYVTALGARLAERDHVSVVELIRALRRPFEPGSSIASLAGSVAVSGLT